MSVPAIILAAGASRRLGRPKQLLEWRGESLLARTIRIATEAGAEPVLVILGAHATAISASVLPDNVVTVLNSEWQEGMASSIRAGLRVLSSCAPDANGAVILSCDQPRLSTEHVRSLIQSFEAASASVVVASVYREVRGVPAVFPQSIFPRLLSLEGDKGARAILADSACTAIDVPFPGGDIDIDLPSDLEQLA
ncbi:MAG TPA: nucleotidyltransferase family protein [Terracidiphilus sp.]|jgi:molybdenum cofactor cytidylyltransferase|nr:nucleotidyltransferase family protein [Terracidiphilus sp.]